MEERLVKSADEMIELGRALGSVLTGSSVIALVGDLGAGKTHLTKGICEAIGAEQTTSPTFTLVNEVLGLRPWVG